MRFHLVLIVLWFFINATLGQNISISPELEQYIEGLVEQNENIDPSSFLNDLEFYSENPLNINTASQQQFESLYLLNKFQILSLLDYRKKVGSILSVYELLYVPGFNHQTVKLLQPFVFVGDTKRPAIPNINSLIKNNTQHFMLELGRIVETKNGYKSTIQNPDSSLSPAYNGDPLKVKARYDFRSGYNIMAGFIAEKDAGETIFKEPSYIDYLSSHIMYKSDNLVKKFIIGDFHFQTGEGLLCWTGYGKGKSIYLNSVTRYPAGIKRNVSVNETGFLRGIAGTFNLKPFEITVFASQINIDATLSDSASGNEIKTLLLTGLHRTDNEIEKRKNTIRNNLGTSFHYISNHYKLGLNMLATKYSRNFYTDSSLVKIFDNKFGSSIGYSADYRALYSKIQFFGETSLSNSALASINTMSLKIYQNNYLLLLYRYFDKSYYSPLADAISEGSSINNEEGFFLGTNLEISSELILSGYMDIFSFPWLRHGVNSPSTGRESRVHLAYYPSENVSISSLYYYQNKELTAEQNNNLNESIDENINHKVRLNIKYKLNNLVLLQNRMEWSQNKNSTKIHEGWLVFQDIRWKTPIQNLTADFRIAWFHIPDYSARIYAYENTVRNSYLVPAYYGIGNKWYCLIKYSPLPSIDIFLRYSQLRLSDRNVIGSSYEQINGNQKSEFKVQFNIKL